MSIDLKTERVMPLAQAARRYPGGGKHASQLHRYRTAQDRPALDCVMVGGIWMTSDKAMQRHVIALTEAKMNAPALSRRHARDSATVPADSEFDAAET
ncbi:MAG: hypothetical protein AAGJ40_09070 [Planctomycetota bacterium]